MTIEFRCPACGKMLRTADDKAGARARCPECGGTVDVPGGAAPSDEFDIGGPDDVTEFDSMFGSSTPGGPGGSAIEAAGAGTGMKNCPMCGAEIRAAAVKCRFCGEMLGTPRVGAVSAPRSVADARSRVQGPAISIIVVTAIFGLLQIAALALNAFAVAAGPQQPPRGRFGPNQQVPPIVAGGTGIVFNLIAIGVSAVIIVGAVKMKNLQSYGLAMTSAILIMVPCLSPCCVLGLPFGIWALVVLNDNDVKSAFMN